MGRLVRLLSIVSIVGAVSVVFALSSAAAATIPVSYVVDFRQFKKHTLASSTLTFELYEVDDCSGVPIAIAAVLADELEIREMSKPTRVKGNPGQKLTRLHFVFYGVSPSTGADLFLKVDGPSGALVPVPIRSDAAATAFAPDCQPQAPYGASGGGGTVTSVDSGAGLSGGPVTSSGTIGIDAPTCAAGELLTWTGSAFQCVPGSGLSCVREEVSTFYFTQTAPMLVDAPCTAGSVVTGGGCAQAVTGGTPATVASTFPSSTTNWRCELRPDGTFDGTVFAYAICCQ